MKKNFFDKINIDLKNAFFPTDFAPNYENYDKKIDECHGIDLQILGIGRNGHIGFNEPGSDFLSKTREIKLTETTIKDNSRFFDKIENVPKTAVTMGISTIMKAKKIILLASGEGKKEIIKKALFGPVMQEVPASVLQRHKDVIVILDKEAALGL
jgi:glucosamine-6-phosphate deaminase